MKTLTITDIGDALLLEFDINRDFIDAVLKQCNVFNYTHRSKQIFGYVANTDSNLQWILDAAPDYFESTTFDKSEEIEKTTSETIIDNYEDGEELRLF